jgi:hypothetical protein
MRHRASYRNEPLRALLTLVALTFIGFNERQVDLAGLVRASPVVRPDDPGAADGALISLTGVVELEGAGLGDGLFLAPGNYLEVERTVEMYAWEEYKSHEDSQGRPVYKRAPPPRTRRERWLWPTLMRGSTRPGSTAWPARRAGAWSIVRWVSAPCSAA